MCEDARPETRAIWSCCRGAIAAKGPPATAARCGRPARLSLARVLMLPRTASSRRLTDTPSTPSRSRFERPRPRFAGPRDYPLRPGNTAAVGRYRGMPSWPRAPVSTRASESRRGGVGEARTSRRIGAAVADGYLGECGRFRVLPLAGPRRR